ncbi:hypothetical protein MOC90_06080 [Bacillus spizizenii]|nr:hypothetical protein [Bacillus spizizenii]MCY8219381.1 hypothetical protein [Bacillus spizizenii]MCY8362105.1 hypothetical protein [Bacillus spizizenii]MCY8369082.1 hypothetical protein [Bacillus spizizenii]
MVETLFASATLLLFVAILTESITEVIKNLFPEGVVQDKITYILSIAVGILLAFIFNLEPFGLEGVGVIVSKVLMGIIASRGANYVNGFLKRFEILR